MPNVLDLDSVFRDRVQHPSPCDYVIQPSQIKEWIKTTRGTGYKVDQTVLHTMKVDSLTLPYPRVELFADTIVNVDSAVNATSLLLSAGHTLAVNDIVECLDSVAPFVRGKQYQVITVAIPGTNFQLGEIGTATTAIITPTNRTFSGVHNQLRFALVTSAVSTALSNALAVLKLPKIYLDVDHENGTIKNQDTMASIDAYHRNDKFVMTLDTTQYDENGQGVWLHYATLLPQIIRFKMGDPVRVRICDRRGVPISVFDDSSTSATYPDPFKQTLISLSMIPFIQDNNYVDAKIERTMLL
jgi:hypothetical protein